MKKYLICPGVVKSISDGDLHFISASRLIDLYQVDRNDCIIVDSENSARGIRWEDFIVLRPRTDGNYELIK